MIRRVLAIILSLSGLVSLQAAGGQEKRLEITSQVAIVDGKIDPGEYSFSLEFGGMVLYMNRGTQGLFAAVEANTQGWVGIGFGSFRMDQARILIGYVEGGKAQFLEQKGFGHSHSDVEEFMVQAYAMSEANGSTVLELELDTGLDGDQTKLPVIVAYGSDDSFTSIHSFRKGLKIGL